MDTALLQRGVEEAPASISKLVNLVSEDMEAVNRLILAMAGSNVQMIPEIAEHLISSGGKRLRPMLTLAAAKMYGYQGSGHVDLAASVEFMHTATLLHDDVVDESDFRRGKLAARKLWGNQASVLVGDFLLGQAFKKMVRVGSLEALNILSTASAVIAEGEVMQLSTLNSLTTEESHYLGVVDAKTAALFSASVEVGPVIAGCGEEDRASCRKFGRNLGMAFQLIDDALDYGGTSKVLGKNVGDDFHEGKSTLPIIIAFREGSPSEKEFWNRCIKERKINDNDLAEAISLLQKYDAIAKTLKKAEEFGEIAKQACNQFPSGEHADSFVEVVDYCLKRVH